MKNHIIRLILNLLPPLRFSSLNRKLFRAMGYNLDSGVVISSSVQLLGAIQISIGRDTFIGHNTCVMGGSSSITIGNNCDISTNVTIISGTHELDPTGGRMAGKETGKDIKIGNKVWIGASALILPGVIVNDSSVVAAGSVVTKNVESFTIVAGNPAKVIKRFDCEKKRWFKP